MKRLVPLALAGLLAWPFPALAASLALTEREKVEALSVGRQSVTRESFDAEWHVANGSGDSVIVLTPFHRLVIAARHAAFKNETLSAAERDRLLKEQENRLVVWARLHGRREDFARFYEPRLLLRGGEIRPTFVQNEWTALPEAGGGFLARCVYGFPVKDLTGTSRVALVVRDADGRDVSQFTIDLARMR